MHQVLMCMLKRGDQSLLLLSGGLFHQYVMDQSAKAEQERLRWNTANHKEIRADQYSVVRDAYSSEKL
jgi:hypothetical protein